MNPIKIGRTRSFFFTKVHKNKIETGIQIFLAALKHNFFEEEILKFQWKNNQNKRFNRFYHAGGLSNRQVLAQIQSYQNLLEEMGSNSKLTILPFSSRKDIVTYQPTNMPVIWISLNCINNDWYTPIHIASAICHDLAIIVGLGGFGNQMSKPEYKMYTAPVVLGHSILNTAMQWNDSITEVQNALSLINVQQYNYFPASEIIGDLYPINMQHNQVNFDKLISSLLLEQESLFALQDKLTLKETKRLVCIEEVLIKLNNLRNDLVECSLDGSDLDFLQTKINIGSRRSN